MKYHLSQKWEDWMVEGDGIVDGIAKELSHKMVADGRVDCSSLHEYSLGDWANVWKKKGHVWVKMSFINICGLVKNLLLIRQLCQLYTDADSLN